MEEWRIIPDFPDYEVSNLGRVRKKSNQTIVAQYKNGGYWSVTISSSRGRKNYRVHSLVLRTFVGERPSGLQGRHLNDDKDDNRLDNLMWGTHQENANDAYINGTRLMRRFNRRKVSADRRAAKEIQRAQEEEQERKRFEELKRIGGLPDFKQLKNGQAVRTTYSNF